MTKIHIRLIDAEITLDVPGAKPEQIARSYIRKLRKEGVTYNGSYYGPGGIVKIDIKKD